MPIEIVPFAGWQKNARLFNADAEAIVTLEVGPRVLSYRTLPNGENLLKRYAEQCGRSGETEWNIRGGHRFWIAPEDIERTYELDNHPCAHEVLDGESDSIVLRNAAVAPFWLEKTLTLTLAESGPVLTLDHHVVNRGSAPIELAPWALTVMKAGGCEVIPQPPLGEHPRDLLPNRRMVVWPYTRLDDPRWGFGPLLWTLKQTADGLPTKIGIAHTAGWAGYLHGTTVFAKTVVATRSGQAYPDDGCNFETFSNREMLEIETLGPLVTLAPGEGASHREKWAQHVFASAPSLDDEQALADLLADTVRASGLLA